MHTLVGIFYVLGNYNIKIFIFKNIINILQLTLKGSKAQIKM